MVKLEFLQSHIYENLMAENKEKRAEHKSSGKLTASSLGDPLQHQILHTIGVPKDTVDGYTLCKFARGEHVEEWLVSRMPGVVDKQRLLEYKDTIGYADTVIDMREWNMPEIGTIPHEIKSTTNAGFKWIVKDGAKRSHLLQGALYALAMGTEHFAIDYVASDDYRVEPFLYEVSDYREDVDSIIERFNLQLRSGIVPEFKAEEVWQEKLEYNSYSAFMRLSEKEIVKKLEKEYPESYKKLKEVSSSGK
jgi:hypothetical protein